MNLPRLIVVTDREASSRPLTETIDAALTGGARAVLFREKDMHAAAREALAFEVAATVAGCDVLLLVASDGGLASRVADRFPGLRVGVHLATSDAAAPPSAAIVGRSCHTAEELAAATAEAVDYVTLSPVAPSRSKPGYGPVLGVPGFTELAATTAVPVYALGGVDASNAGDFLAAGAHGVAVMGALMGARDPVTATAAVVEAIRETGRV